LWSGVHAPAMTMSGGLGSDSTTAVYSEDVVTYVDPDAAHQWDRDGYGGAIGLVSQVAGASDDEESDDSEWEDEEHEVRTFECWLSEPTPSHKGVGVWYTLMYRVYEGSLKNTAPSEIRPAPNPRPRRSRCRTTTPRCTGWAAPGEWRWSATASCECWTVPFSTAGWRECEGRV